MAYLTQFMYDTNVTNPLSHMGLPRHWVIVLEHLKLSKYLSLLIPNLIMRRPYCVIGASLHHKKLDSCKERNCSR